VQYFVSPNAFVGGGVGLGVARIEIDGLGSDSETGFAVDLRAGYSFNPGAKHSFNASVEITPAFIEDVTFTGIAFLAGYQLQ
jgi:outer membrane receptor protein involved in Fe transport